MTRRRGEFALELAELLEARGAVEDALAVIQRPSSGIRRRCGC